jgi:hypothetical protein
MQTIFRNFSADDARAQRKNVGVIVFAGQARGGCIVANCGAHTSDPISCNGNTDTCAADDYTPIRPASGDSLGNGLSEVGIVDRIRTTRPQIDVFHAGLGELGCQLFFKRKPRVIRSQRNGDFVHFAYPRRRDGKV